MDDKFQPKNKNENEPINDLDSLQVRKLHDAVRLDDRALIKNLLKTKTVHINARDETGQTALHIACDRGNLDLVKWLVKKKAVINICNSQGEPPLYRAAKVPYLDICEFLLQQGADPMFTIASNYCYPTVLHYLCSFSDTEQTDKLVEVVRYILSRGFNVNAKNRRGMTALHICSESGTVPVVSVLLRYAPNVNLTDINGETALHYAVKSRHAEVCRLLVLNGADVTIKGKNGTPLDIAKQRNYKDIIDILEDPYLKKLAQNCVMNTGGVRIAPLVEPLSKGKKLQYALDLSGRYLETVPDMDEIFAKFTPSIALLKQHSTQPDNPRSLASHSNLKILKRCYSNAVVEIANPETEPLASSEIKKRNDDVSKLPPKVNEKASKILGIIQPKNDLVEVTTKAAQVLGIPEGLNEQLQPPPSTKKKEKKSKLFKSSDVIKEKSSTKTVKRILDPEEVRNLNEKAGQVLGITIGKVSLKVSSSSTRLNKNKNQSTGEMSASAPLFLMSKTPSSIKTEAPSSLQEEKLPNSPPLSPKRQKEKIFLTMKTRPKDGVSSYKKATTLRSDFTPVNERNDIYSTALDDTAIKNLNDKAAEVLGIKISSLTIKEHDEYLPLSPSDPIKRRYHRSDRPGRERRESGPSPNDNAETESPLLKEGKANESQIAILHPASPPSTLNEGSPIKDIFSNERPSNSTTTEDILSQNTVGSNVDTKVINLSQSSAFVPMPSEAAPMTQTVDRDNSKLKTTPSTEDTTNIQKDTSPTGATNESKSQSNNRNETSNAAFRTAETQTNTSPTTPPDIGEATPTKPQVRHRSNSFDDYLRISTRSLTKDTAGHTRRPSSSSNAVTNDPTESVPADFNDNGGASDNSNKMQQSVDLDSRSTRLQTEMVATVADSHVPTSPRFRISIGLLNLSNNILSQIPDAIFQMPQFSNLKVLDLSNNVFELFPTCICKLEKLHTLYLQRNFLKELPHEIGTLKNLRYLSVYNNFLEKLPKAIGSLKKLRVLHLQFNKLTKLPVELCNLPQLEELLVEGNPLFFDEDSTVDIHNTSCRQLLTLIEREHKQKIAHANSKSPPSTRMTLRQTEGPDLELFLADPKSNASFRLFLEKVYASENLLFYNAVEEYRKLELPRANFCEKAFEIFNTFINPHTVGDKEINLPGWVRDELIATFSFKNNGDSPQNMNTLAIVERNYDNPNITKNTFDKAQKHILEILRYDIWPRFLQSEYFTR
jgi:ankyrin repeat protein/Leucine-rich repeat (LRR) protein